MIIDPQLILFIGLLLFFYLLGVSVPFALGLTAVGFMLSPFAEFQPRLIANAVVNGADAFVLLAIPLFLLTGKYMNMFGVTKVIFSFAKELVGPIRGGLAHVNVLASMLFAGMTGAATADAAGLGVIEYQAMRDEQYGEGYSAAVTAASSIIGPIIPPSIPLIVYAIVAEESIGALFVAGIVPGALMGISLLGIASVYAHQNGYEGGSWWSVSEIGRTLFEALPALGLLLLIIGGIISGLFTATEAGAAALLYTLVIGFVFYDGASYSDLRETTYEGMVTTSELVFIIAMAALYAFLIRRAQVPEIIAESVLAITSNPLILLLLIVAVLLLVGLMMETLAAITILVPVFLPVIIEYSIDPVYFGVLMIAALMMGVLTPPFGLVLFIIQRVTGVKLEVIIRSIVPFYIPLILVILLMILFPEIVLWLPRLAGLV